MNDSVNNTDLNKETPTKTDAEIKTSVEDANLDENGYEKPAVDKDVTPTPDEKPAVDKDVTPTPDEKPVDKSADDKDVTGYDDKDEDATGYGKDDKPVDDKEATPDDKPVDDKIKKEEAETALKDLPENINKEETIKFALDNNLTKEQLEAYANKTKEDNAQALENNKTQVLATRKQWKEDLFKDPEFGEGSQEVFDRNAHKVNQVLKNHMPNMKKVLTDKGTVLPPYIMKDLLGISKALNPTTDLVPGDPTVVKTENNFLEDLYE